MNLASILADHARSRPRKAVVESAQEVLSYTELDGRMRRIATSLRAREIGPGDLVGLHMRDTPAHIAAFLAVMHVGGTALPIDW